MQFENSQFEKGVSQSLKTLEDLKKGLDLKDAGKSLESLQKAGDSFSLAKMANGVEQITEKFSALGIIGKRILENLADSAYKFGVNFVKSVSIDQVAVGWSKYEQKTKAVQQIVNATGLSIKDVDKELEKLIWFSDETSYSFTDMVSNIGKFTSMNIPLDKSVTAMQGISTWAALSGAGIQEANRAMYNLAQAIGLGSVKMQDWKSIALANMATAEFKQTAIDTAVAMGKLKKGAVDVSKFESTLSKGWFTSDVLIEVLGKYGQIAGEVYEVATENNVSAAQAMEMMGDKMNTLGGKAFKAAQEARTFTEAIEAAKDAVSSNWMGIFENIFGNYEEAKVLWTDLANYLWDIFALPMSNLNEVFAEWKELGGRTKLIKGLYDIFDALRNVITAVGDALSEVFPPVTVDNLLAMSDAVADFGKNLKDSLHIYETEFSTFYADYDKIGRLLDNNTFKLGDQGEAVRELQKELVELGYLDEEHAKSGVFNIFTEKAIEKYKAGISGVTKEVEKLDNAFKLGDKGKEVEAFQKKLKELGYDPGAVDGIYGKKTEAAYKKYLKSLEEVGEKRRELKKKDKGDDVKDLQKMLNESGLVDKIQADGVFGPKTEEALKKYQKAKGLTESGILDKDTIEALYGKEKFGTQLLEDIHTWTEYSDQLTRVQRIARGAFSIFSIFGTVIGFVGKVLGHVLTLLSPLGDAFLTIAAAVGDALFNFSNWLKESGKLDELFEKIKTTLEPFGDWVKKAADGLLNFFGLGEKAEGANEGLITFKSLYESTKKSIEESGVIDKVKASWENFKNTLEKIKEPIKKVVDSIKSWFSGKFTGAVNGLPGVIGSITSAIGGFISKGLDKLSGILPKAVKGLAKFIGSLNKFKKSKVFINATNGIKTAFENLKNAFKSLKGPAGDAWKSVKEAIGEKFKRIADKLPGIISNVTTALGNFATKALDGISKFVGKIPEYITKIKNFFSALFSPGDKKTGGKQGFGNKVTEFLKSIPGAISGFVQKVPGYAKKVGSVIKELWESLKMSEKFQALGPKLKGAWETIKEFFSKLWDAIKTFFNTDTSDTESFGDKIKKRLSGFTGLGEWISAKWTSLLAKLGTSWEGIKAFFSKLGDIIKKYGKWAMIIVGFTAVIVLLGRISGLFKKLKIVIASYKKSSQPLSKSIMQFAAAIALLAGSIWLLAQLKPGQLKQGAIALAGIIVVVSALMALSAIFLKGEALKGIEALGSSVLHFAAGIGILVASLIVLSIIPWSKIWDGIGKLALIGGILAVFMVVLSKLGAKEFNYKGLWEIGAVIAILGVIAALIGRHKLDRLAKGVGVIVVIMAFLVLMMRSMGKVGATNIQLKGFIGLAAAVAVLGIVAARLGKMKLPDLAKGVLSIVAIMGMIALIGLVFSKNGKDFKTGSMLATVLGLGAIIVAFGLIIDKIRDVDPMVMLSFSASLAIALAAFVAACMIVGKSNGGGDMLKGALGIGGSIIILAGVVAGIVFGLGKLDESSPGTIEHGGVVLQQIADAISPFTSDFENCIGAAAVLFASYLVGKTNSGWDMISGAFSISAALFILVGALAILTTGLGYLDSLGDGSDLKSSTERGGEILGAITEALGKLKLSALIPIGIALLLSMIFAKISLPMLKVVGNAAAIGLAFDLLVAAIGGLIYGLGKLDEISDGELLSCVERGGDVLGAISNALNKLDLKPLLIIGGLLLAATILGSASIGGFAIVGEAVVLGLAFDALVLAVTGVVAALGKLDQITDGGLVKAIDSGGAVLESLSRALGRVRTGFEQAYNESMMQFAESMHTVMENVSGASEDGTLDADIQKAIEVATKIHQFFLDLETNKMDQTSIINYNSAAEGLTTNLGNFGTAIGEFRAGVSGIAGDESIIDDTDLAIKIATSVKKFFDDIAAQIPDGSGLKEYVEKVSSTVINVGRFGISMALLRIGITGVAKSSLSDDIGPAIAAAQSVADFLAGIKGIDIETNKGELDKWFTGDTKGNTVLDTITKLGESIGRARNSFKGIGAKGDSFGDDITAAVNAMRAVGEMLNYFSSGDVYIPDPDVENGQYAQNFIAALNSIDWIANKIGDFDIATKNHDVAGAASAIQAFADLASVLSGLGETKISTDNFLGDLDATAVVEKLSTFTTDLTTQLSASTKDISGQADAFNSAGSSLAAAVSAGMNSSASIDTSGIESAVSGAVTVIRGYYTKFQSAGMYLDQGLTNGIKFYAFLAVQAARLMANKVIQATLEAFNSNSPSKVFAEIGKYNDMGLAKGMTQYSTIATKAAEGVGESTIETARSSLANLSSILADDIDDTPVVRPVVDLTSAREAASSIGGLFHNPSFGVDTTANLANRASASNSARMSAKQAAATQSSASSVSSTNSAVNLSGNNFYIRSEQDVQSLASEIATLSKQQQRSYGAVV